MASYDISSSKVVFNYIVFTITGIMVRGVRITNYAYFTYELSFVILASNFFKTINCYIIL